MDVLKENIKTLQKIEKKYKTIDNYYSQVIKGYNAETLVSELSAPRKLYKIKQLGFALTCEYLRNAGYDIQKNDKRICRILGKDYLNLSEKQLVSKEKAFGIVIDLVYESGKSVAELITYFDRIVQMDMEKSVKRNAKCEICKVKEQWKMNITR